MEDEDEEDEDEEETKVPGPEGGDEHENCMQRMRLPQRGVIKPQEQAFTLASISSSQSQHCQGSPTWGKGIRVLYSGDKIPRL